MRLLMFLLLCLSFYPVCAKKRVLVVGWDGARGDVVHQTLSKSSLPNLLNFSIGGISSICENLEDIRCAKAHQGPLLIKESRWMTSPGWASVITGVDIDKHSVFNNELKSQSVFSSTSLQHPSFFRLTKEKGMTTAAAGVGAFLTSYEGKSTYYGITDFECGLVDKKPVVLPEDTRSCNLDERRSFNNKDDDRDKQLTAWLKEQILNSSTDLIMGVYDRIDEIGHEEGFSDNKKYKKAIIKADSQFGKLTEAIKLSVETSNDSWLVFLTSDHGGHKIVFWGLHDKDEGEDDTIPFYMKLYGANQYLEPLKPGVSHLDVAPTIHKWLGLRQVDTDGQVQGLPTSKVKDPMP